MITVHHLNNSRSQRVLWLLEELDLEYRVQRYERDGETMRAPPSLRKVHPLGKSPILSHEDRVIAESGAIIEYVTQILGGGRLVPSTGSDEWLRYTYWLHFAEGSLMTPVLLNLLFSRLTQPPVPWIVRPLTGAIASNVQGQFIQPEVSLLLGYVDEELTDSRWFAGSDFSAADIQMSFALEAYEGAGLLDEKYGRIHRILGAYRERPAYVRALERGGPYDLGFSNKRD